MMSHKTGTNRKKRKKNKGRRTGYLKGVDGEVLKAISKIALK